MIMIVKGDDNDTDDNIGDVDVVAVKAENELDYDEGAYYLEQQRMNFFGMGRKDKDMRRRKRNTNFDLVLQRRLPIKELSPIEPPKSSFAHNSRMSSRK